jgi:ribulose bisphosphate carboxylase small subunit
MAVRIRKNNHIFCAALTKPEPGDTYIDDTLHYLLSQRWGVLVTYPEPRHSETGEWWWAENAPPDMEIG